MPILSFVRLFWKSKTMNLSSEWNSIPDTELLITIGTIARARLRASEDKILLNIYQQILSQTVEGLRYEGRKLGGVAPEQEAGNHNESPSSEHL